MAAVDIGAGRRKKEDAIDPAAGFIFHKNVGDAVRSGEPLVTLQGNDERKLEEARQRLRQAMRISKKPVTKPRLIHYYADKNGLKPWNEFAGE